MAVFRLDRAGWPFVGGAVLVAVVLGVTNSPWLLVALCLLAAVFFAFFFRDPDRVVRAGPDDVVAPADGRILVAGPAVEGAAPEGRWQQISIFLSPTDVHVNRVPVSGRVTHVAFTPGRFLPAYRHEAATQNERSEIWIDHGGQAIVARQVVGILARRVVCRLQPGAHVRAGDRYGIMKFGSRMDVFLPPSAVLRVEVGDMVRAGETLMAVLH